jgi:hypothetical protein
MAKLTKTEALALKAKQNAEVDANTEPDPIPIPPQPPSGTVLLFDDFTTYPDSQSFRNSSRFPNGAGPRILLNPGYYSISRAILYSNHPVLHCNLNMLDPNTPSNECYWGGAVRSFRSDFAIRWTPGFTTYGKQPNGTDAYSQKLFGGGWGPGDFAGRIGLEYSNTNRYMLQVDCLGVQKTVDCGLVTTEWQDARFRTYSVTWDQIDPDSGTARFLMDGVVRGECRLDLPAGKLYPSVNFVRWGMNRNCPPFTNMSWQYGFWRLSTPA